MTAVGFGVHPKQNSSSKVARSWIYYNSVSRGHRVPFPAGTQGFLYYIPNTPPSSNSFCAGGGSQTVGQLRFRITDSSDPASFTTGRDLMLPTGLPWLICPHPRPAGAPRSCIWELLLRDGFVSAPNEISRTCRRRRTGSTITTFGEPFVYDFSRPFIWANIVSEIQGGKEYLIRFRNPVRPIVGDRNGAIVYKGSYDLFSALTLCTHITIVMVRCDLLWHSVVMQDRRCAPSRRFRLVMMALSHALSPSGF